MKVLNDAEFLLLYDLYSPQNLDLPCDLYPHFDLQNLTEDECVAEFRFRKTDIPRLSQALRIPDVIICHQGTICEGTEGLCMLLKRLCYPCRYSDMVHLFARPVPVLCMITNQVLDYIYQAHSHRILQWNHQQLSQANLERFAEVVHRKGALLNNCFAFVDGTVRPICRPGLSTRGCFTMDTNVSMESRARSIQPKFPEISVQNSMDQFGPNGKVSKKRVHLLRWTTLPGRTSWNFGWMDRAPSFSLLLPQMESLQICMALSVSCLFFRKLNLGFVGWGGNCLSVFFSFHLEKLLEMKLLGNIQLLFHEKFKKNSYKLKHFTLITS